MLPTWIDGDIALDIAIPTPRPKLQVRAAVRQAMGLPGPLDWDVGDDWHYRTDVRQALGYSQETPT